MTLHRSHPQRSMKQPYVNNMIKICYTIAMNPFLQHLDPRQAFRVARNTSIELTYIGLATQSMLLSYLVFYKVFGPANASAFSTLINVAAVFALLDMGKALLLGQSSGRIWGALFCFFQSLYYFEVVNSQSVMPRTLGIFALVSCLLTLYLLLSKGTKEYLDSKQY